MPRAARVALELVANLVSGALILFPAALLLVATSSVLWSALLAYDGILFTTLTWLLTGLSVAVMWAVLAGVTLAGVTIIGLPLRLIPAVHDWWGRNWWLPLVGMFAGLTVIALSWQFGTTYSGVNDGVEFSQYQPNGWIMLAGWAVFAFFLVNIWFGRRTRPS